uniref:Heme exporter protein D n=1 Tax=Candidatus Kentrum sp. SD TaxID=2126332 RepID=A0A451BNV9_9GAMM|nr:MAG: heme exporter protein D [Candidatus Kentron sp. SD]VFK46994.1 MAG: heme exporter protein D [Candidatus Kentron sp. SD]VFK79948.1 MAG: heme exporter protein D [Candidatus Kentron sp. SD]
MMEFLHMGGYAPYVWSAYGLAFVVLLVNLIQPMLRQRRIERELIRGMGRKTGRP